MAGGLIEEGQARTYSPSLDNGSLKVKELNLPTPSVEAIKIKKSQILKSSQVQKVKDPAMQGREQAKKPKRNRWTLQSYS